LSFSRANYESAAHVIQEQTDHSPQVGLILGSGLGSLADQIGDAVTIPYTHVPHFPTTTVHGHSGELVMGTLHGQAVIAMRGRFHFYEGHTMQQVTFPVRVMQVMGVKTLIVTNAAGGLNPDFTAGSLMLITDHLNLIGLSGNNPLIGPNDDALGPRFPSMTKVYDAEMRSYALEAAHAASIHLNQGVYASISGPAYETPAEVRALRALGADAVGMSTVPEAMVARHAGMRVMGISSVTNIAIDSIDADDDIAHEDVVVMGRRIVPDLKTIILGVLDRLSEATGTA
jgi:purine-nucleoside phosphorylase